MRKRPIIRRPLRRQSLAAERIGLSIESHCRAMAAELEIEPAAPRQSIRIPIKSVSLVEFLIGPAAGPAQQNCGQRHARPVDFATSSRTGALWLRHRNVSGNYCRSTEGLTEA
ncbi:hypothetical protein HJB82_11405 [Rhizobium sp. NZLR10]|uniref:hypothetical protein n=1 Tax=Rhizobium sp. NZLR10 TaxID=2731097 RepID=UPI001C82CCDD|nr:hypothetical protein [Rhizobium sp. NZLR10]MBX5195923.1 hypothetical protein [Rhizobium sp. NZLR10]